MDIKFKISEKNIGKNIEIIQTTLLLEFDDIFSIL